MLKRLFAILISFLVLMNSTVTTVLTAKETDDTLPENVYPAFSEAIKVDDVVVLVEAKEGVFPEGASLSVKKVTDEAEKEVDIKLEDVRKKEVNIAASYTFDIKVLDKNGEEIQPTDNNTVTVSFTLAEVKNDSLNTQVYHIDEEAMSVEALAVTTNGDSAVVEADGFSYYTVEFTYNDLQYVLEGDSNVSLDEVLNTLGLSGTVTNVEVSNPELFKVENNTVYALKAFTTTEWLKVTIDGIVYEIVVTDAIPGSEVTSQVNMNAGEEKTGDFTINGNGVVMGPTSGVAYIKNGNATDNSSNGRNGGVSVGGSAFISRSNASAGLGGTLAFENETIKTSKKNLIFNAWDLATITAKDTTIDGQRTDWEGSPSILIGGSSGAKPGTVTFNGNNTIQNVLLSAITMPNANSKLEVASGTLTIKNSSFKLMGNGKVVVKSGAKLVIDSATINNLSKVVLEEGAELVLTNGAHADLSKGFTVPEGAKVTIEGVSSVDIKNGGWIDNSGTLELTGESSIYDLNTGGGEAILNRETGVITCTDSYLDANNRTLITNNNEVTIDGDSVVYGSSNGNKSLFDNKPGSTMNVGGTTKMQDHNTSSGSMINVNGATLNVTDNPTFTNNKTNENGGVITATNGSTVNIEGGTYTENNATRVGGALYLKDSNTIIGKADFTLNGAKVDVESEQFDAYTTSGGAIKTDGGTLTLNGTKFTENVAWAASQHGSGGAIHATGTEININGAKFNDNVAQLYGGAITVDKNANTKVYIQDLDGDPTEFVGNTVLWGIDFSGGAICIHGAGNDRDGYVKMEDAAIYDNYADGAGGGISTCQLGVSSVLVVDGAAIFNNTVGSETTLEDAKSLQDVYVFRNDSITPQETEIYESMFNGGLHNWTSKAVNPVTEFNELVGSGTVAQSTPTNTDISNAKVIFTKNKALSPWTTDYATIASGGAISNNGILEIGRSYEIKIVKAWDDVSDKDGKRLTDDEFLEKLVVTDPEGNTVDLKDKNLKVSIVKDGTYMAGYISDTANPTEDVESVELSDDRWMIVVSGLPLKGTYKVEESEIAEYQEIEAKDAIDQALQDTPATNEKVNYFSFVNHYDVEVTELEVEKVWDDPYNLYSTYPTITVALECDGEEISTVELSEDNNWKHVFEGLDPDKKYSVVEKSRVPRVMTEIIEKEGSVVINNIVRPWFPETPGEEYTHLKITKTQEGLKSDASYKLRVTINDYSETITLKANETHTYEYVTIGSKVTIKEEESDKYTATYYVDGVKLDGNTFVVASEREVVCRIHNKSVPDVPKTADTTNTGLWLIVFGISLCAILTSTIFKKKYQ